LDLSAQCLGYLDHLPKGLTGWSDRWHFLPRLRTDLETKLGKQSYKNAVERGASLDFNTIAAKLMPAQK